MRQYSQKGFCLASMIGPGEVRPQTPEIASVPVSCCGFGCVNSQRLAPEVTWNLLSAASRQQSNCSKLLKPEQQPVFE